jgi:hypothetical protein
LDERPFPSICASIFLFGFIRQLLLKENADNPAVDAGVNRISSKV